MTYLEKKNIEKYIHQKMRNKDVYESDIHNIYNIIMGRQMIDYSRGGIGRHLTCGQDTLIPHWLHDNPKEAILLKKILKTPHPLSMPGNQETV